MSKNRSKHERNNYKRKNKPNAGLFFAVLITLIILLIVGIYIYYNDTKQPVLLDVCKGFLFILQ